MLATLVISIGAIAFFIFKRAMEFASKVTGSSQDFSRIPFLQKGSELAHQDKVFLTSCKPLEIKVGATFIITKESFPTISQDIILGILVNLLMMF